MKKQLLLITTLFVFSVQGVQARSHNHHSRKNHAVACVKPKALIWDVGGTMMTVDKMAMIKHIGLGDAIAMFFKHGTSCISLMKDTVFDFLEVPTYCDDPTYPCDPYGKLLPKLMVEWFMGTMTGPEILEKVTAKSEQYEFSDKHHERITMRTLRWMFDPEIMANGMKPIRSSAKLLHDCACVTDEDGNCMHSFHILSNWGDLSSFEAMMNKKSNQCIFKYFYSEHIHVSSVIHDIKPHKSAFQYVLEHDNLKAEDCIFFDDQDDNLRAAEACGMKAIKVTGDNGHKIHKQLKELGVLPRK
jgi:putative hydrolase of the HAD superfamily